MLRMIKQATEVQQQSSSSGATFATSTNSTNSTRQEEPGAYSNPNPNPQAKEEKEERRREKEEEMARAMRYRAVLAAQVKDIQNGRAAAWSKWPRGLTAQRGPPAGSEPPSGPERRALVSWVPRRGRCGALVPAQSRSFYCLWPFRCGRPGLARDDPHRGEPQQAAAREYEGAQVRGLQFDARLSGGG